MNRKILFGGIIVFIILILLYGILLLTNKTELNLQDKNKDIIYDKVNNKNKKIPYVNLVGEDINKINENIDLFVKDYLNENNSNVSYEYNKNGNILSILIRIIYYNGVDAPEIKFTSYNILLNDSYLISDDELFTLINSNKGEVNKIIENSFIDYYNESEIRKNLSYQDFIKYRDYYFNIDKDISYYIDNNKIYGYININKGMDYSEYEYFQDLSFKVLVGDINA